VCLKLKVAQPANPQQQQQQQINREDLEELIRQQLRGDGNLQQQQQQQQQGDVLDVWLVNTHLDHASPEIRARQMQVRGSTKLYAQWVGGCLLYPSDGVYQVAELLKVPLLLVNQHGFSNLKFIVCSGCDVSSTTSRCKQHSDA
jgi:hypothetical protein